MRLREAGPDDVPAVNTLVERGYRGDSARGGWTHEADLLDGQRTDAAALAAIVADPKGALLLLEDADGALVGCVQLVDKGDGLAYLGMLTVDPARQAAGLGRRLLEAGEDWARARGAAAIEMTVIRQRPELIAWYERRGWRRTGETRPFPLTDPRFGLPKRQDLAFVVLAKPLGPAS